MGIKAYIPESTGTFQPAPGGIQHAVCVDITDLGLQRKEWSGEVSVKPEVEVAWQLAKKTEDGKPFMVWKRYTNSLHENANLRHDLEGWRGKKFSKDEIDKYTKDGFDLEKLLGLNCMLTIVHNESRNGKTYANVDAIAPLMDGLTKLTPDYDAYTRKADRDDYEEPCYDKEKVLASGGAYQNRQQSNGQSGGDGAQGSAPQQANPVTAHAPQPAPGIDFDAEDDLPF